jgi:hypothetical protein
MLVGVAFHKGRRAAKSRILSDEYIYFLLPNYLTPFLTFCMNSRAFYYGITYDKLFAALVFRSKIALISLLGLINRCGLAMLHKLAGGNPVQVIASHEPGIEPCRHIGNDVLDA